MKGKVHDSRTGDASISARVAYRFLFSVIRTALERGGKPIINGRPLSRAWPQQGFDVGIPQDNTEETAMQTMVLAEEAGGWVSSSIRTR